MALVNLLFQTGPVKIDVIPLDVAISESHVGEVEVTQHPVESGFSVTDHARVKPDTLTLEGVVSNTPLNRTQQLRAVQAQGQELQSNTLTDAPRGQAGYAEAAYQKLRELRDSGKVITVVTGLRTYDNMVMTSLTIPRSVDTGDTFRFSAVFQQVRIVTNKFTKATVTKAKVPKAIKKVKLGAQVTEPTKEPEEQKVVTPVDTDNLQSVERGVGGKAKAAKYESWLSKLTR